MITENQTTRVFTIRIMYKNGQIMTFDCTKFNIDRVSGVWEWEAYGNVAPLLLGIDEVAAVWKIDERDEVINTP